VRHLNKVFRLKLYEPRAVSLKQFLVSLARRIGYSGQLIHQLASVFRLLSRPGLYQNQRRRVPM
jgi:hypothetical protein